MERFHFLKNKNFIPAFLDLYKDYKEKGQSSKDIELKHFSELMSSIMLNHYKNHDFSFLSKDQIREKLNAHYDFQQSIGRIKLKRI